MNEPVIRCVAGDLDYSKLVPVLARAFWDDPLFDFLAKDDLLKEYRLLPHVFRAALTDFRSQFAEQYVTGRSNGIEAFAGWLGPGAFPRPPLAALVREVRAATVLLRVRNRRAASALLQEVERRHPKESHWYLALLATDPRAQGQGMGSALLRPVLAKCDADATPAYTETQKFDNVAWYGRFGFTVVDELRMRGAPPIWRLWREPRPEASDNASSP